MRLERITGDDFPGIAAGYIGAPRQVLGTLNGGVLAVGLCADFERAKGVSGSKTGVKIFSDGTALALLTDEEMESDTDESGAASGESG